MNALRPVLKSLLAGLLTAAAFGTRADVITEWSIRTGELITEARIGTPPAVRIVALVQTAAYGAVNAVTQRHPRFPLRRSSARRALIDAAVAAAHRATLLGVAAGAANLDRGGLPGGTGAGGRRSRHGCRRGDRREGGRRGAGAAPSRRRIVTRGLPPAHHRRRICADPCGVRPAVATAQALADDERGAVPPRRAPALNGAPWAQRLQRSERLRRQGEHTPQHRTDRDRALLGILAAGDLPRRGALGGAAAGPRSARNARLFA